MTPKMGRTRVVLLLLIAALFAFEPVVHTHPLAATDAAGIAPCVACAGHTARIADPTPAAVAPQRVAYLLTDGPLAAVDCVSPLALPSRAPPAA